MSTPTDTSLAATATGSTMGSSFPVYLTVTVTEALVEMVAQEALEGMAGALEVMEEALGATEEDFRTTNK